MKKETDIQQGRRDFLLRVVPACGIMYMVAPAAMGSGQRMKKLDQLLQECDFDEEYPHKQSYREVFAGRYREVISLANHLEKELGHEKTLELIKRKSDHDGKELGKGQAERFGKNDLKTYVEQFRPANYTNLLEAKVVEDTDKAFALHVSKCIWAETFRKNVAADLGYAYVCYGDFSWAEGFNPEIRLERDKTLMEGHNCCNHRYVMKG